MIFTLLGVVLGFTVGVYAFANAVLPVFWARPRASRMYLQERLVRPLPSPVFLYPFAFSLTVIAAFAWGIRAYAPSLWSGAVVGLALGFLGVMRKFMVRDDPTLYVDFMCSYGRYFVTPTEGEHIGMAQVTSGLRKPTHREYLLLLDRCAVVTAMDMPHAYRLSESLPLSLRYRSFLLGAFWMLSIPAALAASYWLWWWVGLVMLFTVTPWLFRWGKAATALDVIARWRSTSSSTTSWSVANW